MIHDFIQKDSYFGSSAFKNDLLGFALGQSYFLTLSKRLSIPFFSLSHRPECCLHANPIDSFTSFVLVLSRHTQPLRNQRKVSLLFEMQFLPLGLLELLRLSP